VCITNLLIVTTYETGQESAASNRMSCIASGFATIGVKVSYVSLAELEKTNTNRIIRGVLFRLFIGMILVYRKLTGQEFTGGSKRVAIYLYTESIALGLITVWASKAIKAKVYLDVCEWWGMSDYKQELKGAFRAYSAFGRARLFRSVMFRITDGLVCISSAIEKRLPSLKNKAIIVPALYDPKDFLLDAGEGLKTSSRTLRKVIFYAGSFKSNESPIVFIKSIIRILSEVKELQWVVCGPLNPITLLQRLGRENDKYLELQKEGKIIYHGLVNRGRYLKLMKDSDLIVLPRDNSMRSDCSFPTRLPEFLASSVPVLTLRTEETDRYLLQDIDYISSYFLREDLLYLKLLDCVDKIRNYEILNFTCAERAFSNLLHCKRLRSFMSGNSVISKVYT
jgi:glycosyltransferase involved in cell wall biosynthesis